APAKPGQSRVGDLDVKLSSKKLTVQGVPAEALEGTATVKGGVLTYELTGKTLGGSFELKGSYPGPRKDAPGVEPVGLQKKDGGSLRIRGVDLSRLAPELGYRSLAPLRGIVDVTFDYEGDLSSGSGRILVRGLGWGAAEAPSELSGVLVLSD